MLFCMSSFTFLLRSLTSHLLLYEMNYVPLPHRGVLIFICFCFVLIPSCVCSFFSFCPPLLNSFVAAPSHIPFCLWPAVIVIVNQWVLQIILAIRHDLWPILYDLWPFPHDLFKLSRIVYAHSSLLTILPAFFFPFSLFPRPHSGGQQQSTHTGFLISHTEEFSSPSLVLTLNVIKTGTRKQKWEIVILVVDSNIFFVWPQFLGLVLGVWVLSGIFRFVLSFCTLSSFPTPLT